MTVFFKTITLACILLTTLNLSAERRKKYIHKYKKIAIQEMLRTGIPASIGLAQGILESGDGNSNLALDANNHFGIKCHDWTGKTYTMDDDAKDECFRKYNHPEESWLDHSKFLTSRPRYAELFQLKTTDYKGWARGLKAAGYATNPKYADLLIKIIEEEGLHEYDRKVKETIDIQVDIPIEEFTEATTPTNNISYRKREEMRNGVTCILAQSGDNFNKIGSYYGIKLRKLLEYNDRTSTVLKIGEVVFLKRKPRRAARGYEFHRVKAGEDLYRISQMYGVRIKNLSKYNYLSEEETSLTEGEKIYLRSKADLL